MSKYVKDLVSQQIAKSVNGIDDALLVDVIGMSANLANVLRGELEKKGVRLLVVKSSLANRAFKGTRLETLFDGVEGSAAVCWGSEDIVTLSKVVVELAKDKRFADVFVPKAGVMDGEHLDAAQVAEVSKWPSRVEQLSMLVGQILGPGANLAAALLGPGSTVAGQIASIADHE